LAEARLPSSSLAALSNRTALSSGPRANYATRDQLRVVSAIGKGTGNVHELSFNQVAANLKSVVATTGRLSAGATPWR
jgi:hypothetical protein